MRDFKVLPASAAVHPATDQWDAEYPAGVIRWQGRSGKAGYDPAAGASLGALRFSPDGIPYKTQTVDVKLHRAGRT